MKTIKNINDELLEFSGSEKVFLHNYGFTYTEGVQHLAEHFGCYWLIADIFIHSKSKAILNDQAFQVWKLERVHKTNSFTLSAEDGNYNVLFKMNIRYSDFSGDKVTLWFVSGTMLLPSEY